MCKLMDFFKLIFMTIILIIKMQMLDTLDHVKILQLLLLFIFLKF